MTVPIEISNIRPEKLLDSNSRYLKQNIIYWGENRLIAFDTYLRNDYILTGNEKVLLITKGIEYRPDLISFEVYGVPNFWWRILEANGMKDIFEFKAGKTIFIPNLF